MSDQLQEYIKQTTFIQRTPQEVFDAITSAEAWHAFFTHSSALDPRPGGAVLRLTEQGDTNDSKGRAMALECTAGWGEAIRLLKFYLEHGLIYTTPPTK